MSGPVRPPRPHPLAHSRAPRRTPRCAAPRGDDPWIKSKPIRLPRRFSWHELSTRVLPRPHALIAHAATACRVPLPRPRKCENKPIFARVGLTHVQSTTCNGDEANNQGRTGHSVDNPLCFLRRLRDLCHFLPPEPDFDAIPKRLSGSAENEANQSQPKSLPAGAEMGNVPSRRARPRRNEPNENRKRAKHGSHFDLVLRCWESRPVPGRNARPGDGPAH